MSGSHMIGQGPVKQWPWTSTVSTAPEARSMSGPGPVERVRQTVDSAGTGPHLTCVMVNTKYGLADIQNIMQSSGSRDARLQALKLQAASLQAFPQRHKLQARVHKLQDPSTRVQAYKLRGPGSQATRIIVFKLCFHVKANLVG